MIFMSLSVRLTLLEVTFCALNFQYHLKDLFNLSPVSPAESHRGLLHTQYGLCQGERKA